jgi:protein-tyrosine phosphatase
MAAVVLRRRLADAALPAAVDVSSSGVSAEEAGNPIDRRAARALARRGYEPGRGHRAHRITGAELRDVNLILPSTSYQLHWLLAHGARAGQARMIREFAPEFDGVPAGPGLDLEDPWYGTAADFETALDQIEAAAPGVVEYVRGRVE